MKKRLIYLDNAATSWPKPASVSEAMAAFLRDSGGNPGRGGHELARRASETVEAARGVLAGLIAVEEPRRVVLTHGCTDALNMAIHGVMRSALATVGDGAKPKAICSCLEHNAVLRTLHCYEAAGVIDVDVVGCDSEGLVEPEEYLALCDERTVLACLTHASNVIGTIQEVGVIGAGIRERSPRALYLVDVAQTIGHIPIDAAAGFADLMAIAGHKGLRGPTGTGALYVGPRAFPDDPDAPRLFCERRGGTGMIGMGLEMPRELPDALEAGTANAVGFAGLMAAVESRCADEHETEVSLTSALLEAVCSVGGVTVYGRRDLRDRTSVVLFNVDGVHPREVARLLDEEFGIAVRGGVHCAPLAHNAIGTGDDGAVRASVGPCNTEDDVAALREALVAISSGALTRG